MRKRGWNDEVSETLKRRKKEAGMAGRSEIETMFAFIDADEGRTPVGTLRLRRRTVRSTIKGASRAGDLAVAG